MRANAATAETKLRDKPKSRCQIGRTRPSEARKEKEIASATKQTSGTPSGDRFDCGRTADPLLAAIVASQDYRGG